MNRKKSKRIRKAVSKLENSVLIAVRNEYGEMTNEMDERQLYKAAKKLYKRGLIKI